MTAQYASNRPAARVALLTRLARAATGRDGTRCEGRGGLRASIELQEAAGHLWWPRVAVFVAGGFAL